MSEEKFVSYTCTDIYPPSIEECLNEIAHHSMQVKRKKWFQDKSYNKSEIKRYLEELEKQGWDY